MSISQFTATPFIKERSEATPGLWNNIFSVISQNVDQLNSDVSLKSPFIVSGSTATTLNTLGVILKSYDSGGALFNVVAFGADPSGVADSTTAIQNAINTANVATGGLVFVPAGQYAISTISLYRNVILRGAGGGRSLGATTPTLLVQKSSASTTMVLMADAGGSGAIMEDIGLYSGQNNNFGGVRIVNMSYCQLHRVSVSGMTGYTIQVQGGANANFAGLVGCALTMTSVGTVFDVQSNSTAGMDSPYIVGCYVSTSGPVNWMSFQSTSGGIAPDSPLITNNRMISSSNVTALYGQMVNGRVIGNRFETTGGSLTVTLAPPSGTQPAAMLVANSYAATGAKIFNDSANTPSARWMEIGGPAFGQVNTMSGVSVNPAYAFSSEQSLGFYRSAVSTVALSYGTLDLAVQSVRLSVRTVGASLTSLNMAVNEALFSVGGASGASLAIRSGGTVWVFNSSTSTVG